MADSSPLAGSVNRARSVFFWAGTLARAFRIELNSGTSSAAERWQKHEDAFGQFLNAVLGVREDIQHPSVGFEGVTELLLEAARIARRIHHSILDEGSFTAFSEVYPGLRTIFKEGRQRLKGIIIHAPLCDPFAFVDIPTCSLLDVYPATPAGHVAFLEFVRDEVHGAAEAKRNMLREEYSNDTIESMVRAIKWAEASTRLKMLSHFPQEVRAKLTDILRRELTVGTIQQIDSLLDSAIQSVRNAWEDSRHNETSNQPCAKADTAEVSMPDLDFTHPHTGLVESAPQETTAGNIKSNKSEGPIWLARAMLIVQKHPDLSNLEIAARVGKHPSTLSRSPQYRIAAAMARERRTKPVEGYIKRGSTSSPPDIEAIAPAESQFDDKADRGKSIPNSKYYREYCANCGDAIKVPPEAVGKNPV